MTTRPQNDGRGSANRNHLVDAIGETTTAAIEGLIGEQLHAALDRVETLAARQAANVEAARQLPEEQRVIVAPIVDRATDAVATAADEADEASDTAAAGRRPNLVATEQATDAAEQAVEMAERSIEARVSALEEAVASHGESIASLGGRMDQLEACVGEVQVVSATAFASAQAGDATYAWRRAGTAALVAGGLAFLLYLLALLGPATWDWNWAIGLPAVVAGVAAAIVFVLSHEDGPSTTSVAAADAIVARWQGSPHRHHDEVETLTIMEEPADEAAYPHGRGSATSARAAASTR
jgi:hypothetical protein